MVIVRSLSLYSKSPCSSRDVPGEPIPDSPPPPPPRRQRRQRDPSPETIDPTGRVEIPEDPNLASGPGPSGEQILAEAFPHLPDPLNRDPRDLDQPLVPPAPSNSNPDNGNTLGGAKKKKTLSFSNPKKGNFSYRRRKPDVSFLQRVLSNLN